LRIEQSRKHGAFDSRSPLIRHKPVPASLWRFGEERLDWHEFLARFFPDRRRHDREALAAYESYVNDVESRSAFCPVTASPSTAAPGALPDATQLSEDEEEPPATADTDRWQGEGGALAGRSRRPRRGERPVGTQRV
jgi:hypothetical protein